MPEYRAYTVGDDGHFIGFEPLVCANDGEAITKAQRLVDGHDLELWSGERFVKRLETAEKHGGEAISHEIKDGRMVPKNRSK
jgi:hypothetical protein